jgi:hypothetical protein
MMSVLRLAIVYLQGSRLRDWAILAPVAVVALALAILGYSVDCDASCHLPFQYAVLQSFSLLRFGRNPPLSHAPWELIIAPFLIPAVALLNGAKLAILNLRKELRVILAQRLRDHTILCGLGDTGRQIVENLHVAGKPVVVITLDTEDAKAAACEQLGIPVLKGDARQLSLLNLAGLRRARVLIATCGSDAVNIEIALRACEALADKRLRPGSFQVLPELRSQWLLDTITTHPAAVLGSEDLEFRPFDLCAGAVHGVLSSPAFERAVRDPSCIHPQLFLAGLDEVNTQLLLNTVRNSFAVPDRRVCAIAFDVEGQSKGAVLQARFPGLLELADIDFVNCDCDSGDPSVWTTIEKTLTCRPRGDSAVAVIVALNNDDASLRAALRFRERLDWVGWLRTPVFVRLREQSKLGEFAASLDGLDVLFPRLLPFGDIAALTKPHMLFDRDTDELARALHAIYLETTTDPGEYPAALSWAQLPERFKESNRLFAEHLRSELRQIGVRLINVEGPLLDLYDEEIEQLAAMEHWRWWTERRSLGWKHGTLRDDVARRHPLLVEWADLTDSDRERNRLLVRAAPKIAAAAGMSLRRERFVRLSGGDLSAVSSEIDALSPIEQGILLVDPQNPQAWSIAQQTLKQRDVKIWIVWRDTVPIPAFPKDLNEKEALRPAVEMWITELMEAQLARHDCSSNSHRGG